MDTRSLRSKGSQETLASLVQLDPAPIEAQFYEEYDDEKDLPPLPSDTNQADSTDSLGSSSYSTLGGSGAASPTSTSRGVGLSGSGHGAIYYLTRIQRYSSYTLSLFGTLHLATTSLIPLAVARSVPASESYLLLAREIYQTSLSEPLLVALPIALHIGSGIALRLLRRRQNLRRYYGSGAHEKTPRGPSLLRSGWPPMSYIALSGYGFSVVLAAHVFMNRGLPLLVEGDSANIGLAYVAHGFARHPVVSWVSYVALLGLGCGHMVWGWAKWFGVAQGAGWKLDRHTGNAVVDRQNKRSRRRRLLLVNGVAAAAAAVWAAGGLGIVARGGLTLGWVGKLYDGLYDKIPGF